MQSKSKQGVYYAGLSGIALPIPQYQFPPPYQDASRLAYYASFFNSLEVNSCFYKVPKAATIAKWSNSVPEHFKFTFKLWKEITHNRSPDFERSHVADFLHVIDQAGAKRGCLLIQLPPSVTTSYFEKLEKLLACIREHETAAPWNVAVEFRHQSWYTQKTYDLLDSYKTALVMHDMPSSATPFTELKSNVVFVRFHGPSGNYDGSYSEDFLAEYAGYIRAWLKQQKTVFVYFNNTKGDAFNNLKTLNGLLDNPKQKR